MKTLVLIDNDALSRALLAQCLTGQGWRVLEAEDGEAGLDSIEKNHPAAVICDLRTPKRNGFKVCRSFANKPQLKSMRVLLTGVSRFANDRDTAFATGADDYLVKPIVPADLLAALDNAEDDERSPRSRAKPVVTGPTLIRFWGVRGSIPTPGIQTAMFGGNTSCVEVRVGDQIIILDAGSGIRALGQALMREFREQAAEDHDAGHSHALGPHPGLSRFSSRPTTRRSMCGSLATKARCTVCAARSSSKCKAPSFPSASTRWRAT